MTLDEARQWLIRLDKAVSDNAITQYQAWEEVFAELEDDAHSREVYDLLYDYTRKE